MSHNQPRKPKNTPVGGRFGHSQFTGDDRSNPERKVAAPNLRAPSGNGLKSLSPRRTIETAMSDDVEWPQGVRLTEERLNYILFGDETGRGGHSSLASHFPLPHVNGKAKTYFTCEPHQIPEVIKQIVSRPEKEVTQGGETKLCFGAPLGQQVKVVLYSSKYGWDVHTSYPFEYND